MRTKHVLLKGEVCWKIMRPREAPVQYVNPGVDPSCALPPFLGESDDRVVPQKHSAVARSIGNLSYSHRHAAPSGSVIGAYLSRIQIEKSIPIEDQIGR